MKNNITPDWIMACVSRAKLLTLKKDYKRAITIFSQLIENIDYQSPFITILLNERATLYSLEGDWDSAISDIKKCIVINPDNGGNFLQMGVYIAWKHFYSNKFRIDAINEELKLSNDYYKECLKRDPTNITAWLNIIETYLFLMEWDNALSYLGMSKSYLVNKENKLIWIWLTCISLALAGEPVEQPDIDLLSDSSEKYETSHDPKQIDSVFSELERIKFYPERLRLANKFHLLYKNLIGVN